MSERDSRSKEQEQGDSPPDLDSDIIRRASAAADDTGERQLAHLQVGAAVYGADGAEVAVVESVELDHVVLLAGFPSRPVYLPASAIALVSPDGQRLDLRIPAGQIERLAGQDEPGYLHLEAQQTETYDDAQQGDDKRIGSDSGTT
jgi:hypothetical protein